APSDAAQPELVERRQPPTSATDGHGAAGSEHDERDDCVYRLGELSQVGRVGGENCRVVRRRGEHHGSGDNVTRATRSKYLTNRIRDIVVEPHGDTRAAKPGERSLTGTLSPDLGVHDGGQEYRSAQLQRLPADRVHSAIRRVLEMYERTGVQHQWTFGRHPVCHSYPIGEPRKLANAILFCSISARGTGRPKPAASNFSSTQRTASSSGSP